MANNSKLKAWCYPEKLFMVLIIQIGGWTINRQWAITSYQGMDRIPYMKEAEDWAEKTLNKKLTWVQPGPASRIKMEKVACGHYEVK